MKLGAGIVIFVIVIAVLMALPARQCEPNTLGCVDGKITTGTP